MFLAEDKVETLVACVAHKKAFEEDQLEAAKLALAEAELPLNTVRLAHVTYYGQ